ncbi:Scr1 family TA system antitoxin-like transcriptional regulator [Plantactinospora solaniradicis]|uniref:Scr1 family TA system antitoxin-like transcriptional regulator n=1 Tax=Plantactinospora solaniradicis TaxID=1723736 RepID=A0ABW1K7I8_9ACTN
MAHPPTLELFAEELRLSRTAAGMSQDALGAEISFSASLVAGVEQCRRIPQPEFTARCDSVLKTGGRLERIRLKLGRDVVLPWFREWVLIEREATMLRSYEPLVVPGLLQTEEYARMLHEGASPLIGEQMEQQVVARMERQAVLSRESPPVFVAVLDEHILHRPVGGPEVMAAQLRHLVEVGRRPRVHLQVVPTNAGAYPGLNGAFVLATPPEGDDAAYLDDQLQGHVVQRPADITLLQQIWETVRTRALPHEQSVRMIEEAAVAWS